VFNITNSINSLFDGNHLLNQKIIGCINIKSNKPELSLKNKFTTARRFLSAWSPIAPKSIVILVPILAPITTDVASWIFIICSCARLN